jgi:glycosyltransferase involved in cell wall biosynthesis
MFVVHVGFSGFPAGNATTKRIILTLKAFRLGGYTPLVINKQSQHVNVVEQRVNRTDEVPYINTSLYSNRPESFFTRNLNKVWGFISECVILYRKRKKIHTLIFYHSSIAELVYYWFLSRLFRFTLIIQYVELRSSIIDGSKRLTRLNNRLFDAHFYRFCDGVIVISEFLKEQLKQKSVRLPYIKVPAICDFDDFNKHKTSQELGYMMYCGGIGYLPVIHFILDWFQHIKTIDLFHGKLLLVLGVGRYGSQDYEKLMHRIISSGLEEQVIVKKDVPFSELVDLYLSAHILLIPLRDTIQDKAGFHHKVGEYTAARKPIISTNYGEISYYFKDGVSAILASENTIEEYTRKLSGVVHDRLLLESIGNEGFNIGNKFLNYKNYAVPLVNFIESLNHH